MPILNISNHNVFHIFHALDSY